MYVVDRATLNRIEFADGRVEKYTSSFKDPAHYEGQLKKAIKVNFMAPLFGFAQFSFEKSVSPLRSYEIGFGIIGAGKNSSENSYYVNNQYQNYKRNARGAFIDGGYKFNKLPDFFSRGSRMTHVMQGTYVKPTATLGFYTDNALNYKSGVATLEKRNNVFGAIIINFGRQWVFGDKFLLDIYGGAGYGFDNSKERGPNLNTYEEFNNNHFVVQKADRGVSLGISGGCRIGFLLK